MVRYISRSPRVPRAARCIEGCERETLTTNGLNQRFPRQGKNGRKTGMYMDVHEDFEPIFNAVLASVVVLILLAHQLINLDNRH
jgi:hypothetical protein